MTQRVGACGHPVSSGSRGVCGACYAKRGRKGPKVFIASKCGHPSTIPGKYCRACYDKRRTEIEGQKVNQAPPSGSASLSVKGDTAEVGRMTPENVRTLADLVRVCEIDTSEWIVERWIANKWEMGAKDNDGNIVTTPLYQVKAWLVRNKAVIQARTEIAALIADAKAGMPKLPPMPAVKRAASGLMLEINVADLHVGKLGWGAETGHGNYDSREAEREHDHAVETLLARCQGYTFERILIVLGNDLIHVDGRANATTAGTQQDTDSRYYKLFLSVRRMATRMIDRCRARAAHVDVAMVPGNHDRDSVWHLGDSLACLYEQIPSVTIDNAPTQRKYIEFGKVMLLLTHGHLGKRDDYPLLMATEQPAMFGRTLYREAHTGHLHQTRVQEHHGVRVRILPALSGVDAWHAENGYVGNIRAAEAFVWSKDEGLVSTVYYNARNPKLERTA